VPADRGLSLKSWRWLTSLRGLDYSRAMQRRVPFRMRFESSSSLVVTAVAAARRWCSPSPSRRRSTEKTALAIGLMTRT
jgi:hypothetical protein